MGTFAINFAWDWYYFLFSHAVLFFLIPLCRSQLYKRWNKRIEKRNKARLKLAKDVWNLRHGVASFPTFEHHLRCLQYATSLSTPLQSDAIYTTQSHNPVEEAEMKLRAEQELARANAN